MALVKDLQINDKVSHYGTFRNLLGRRPVENGDFVLTLQEDGAIANRTENGKTNLVVEGE